MADLNAPASAAPAAPTPPPRPLREAGSLASTPLAGMPMSSSVATAVDPKEAQAPSGPVPEPEIHTIPEKFYGAALRATLAEQQKEKVGRSPGGQPVAESQPRPAWFFPMVGGIAILVIVAGGFVFFNRDLIFAKPAPAPAPAPEPEPTPPPAPIPPAAPTNLTASTTALTVVHLAWTDAATDESSYRVERRETTTSYAPIRNLAPNETSYDDPAVSADTDYFYRVVAVNTNGESPSNEASVRTEPSPIAPPPAPVLPPAGLDSDSDGLTDLEEPLYGSPVRDPDADKDSYNDGNEVYHLYSPSGKAPGKLLESGLVKKMESPVGWSFYAPSPWQASVQPDGLKGAILTGHGEAFVATVEDNPEGKPLLDWYLARNLGVLSSQVTSIATQSGFEGIEGIDQLSAYFAWGNKVFVIRYDLDGQPFVNFRTTFEMMKNSLQLTAAPIITGGVAASAEPPPADTSSSSTPSGPTPPETPSGPTDLPPPPSP